MCRKIEQLRGGLCEAKPCNIGESNQLYREEEVISGLPWNRTTRLCLIRTAF